MELAGMRGGAVEQLGAGVRALRERRARLQAELEELDRTLAQIVSDAPSEAQPEAPAKTRLAYGALTDMVLEVVATGGDQWMTFSQVCAALPNAKHRDPTVVAAVLRNLTMRGRVWRQGERGSYRYRAPLAAKGSSRG